MYDGSSHQDGWRHIYRTCKSCNSKWQPVDFKSRLDRLSATRRPNKDDMIGREVVARVAYGFSVGGGGRFLAREVRGQVWSEADPTVTGSRKDRAYWIADGQHYYAAAASDLIDSPGNFYPKAF